MTCYFDLNDISEWSASEAEPASCEEKSEKSSKSKSKKKSKRDDSDSDSDSDPDSGKPRELSSGIYYFILYLTFLIILEGLRAAISNYSKSVKREDEERKGRSKSPVDDDPFERHNQVSHTFISQDYFSNTKIIESPWT